VPIDLRRLLTQVRYIPLIGVLASLIASLTIFVKAATMTLLQSWVVLTDSAKNSHYEVQMIEIMDQFLVGIGFLVFALGIYEIFISPLALPPALTFRNLHDVKASLSNIIVLAMAVTFLEKLESFENPQDTLFFGLAIAIVSAVLIAFRHFGTETEHQQPSKSLPTPKD
jgi:uncharacterized membrane protein YqhA